MILSIRTCQLFLAITTITVVSFYPVTPSIGSETIPLPAQNLELITVIQSTLANQPAIYVRREQLSQGAASIDLALADFDWKVDTSLTYGTDYKPAAAGLIFENTKNTVLDLRFSKKTKYGLIFEPGLTFKSSDGTSEQISASDSLSDKTLRVYFNLNIPLLQGAGKNTATARESAARSEYEAGRNELLHTISLSVFDSVAAYWIYTASFEKLKHAVAAEERAERIVENTESLVNADEIPKSELIAAQSNLLEKKIVREHAALNLVETRHKLGLTIGINATDTEALSLPADALPIITPDIARKIMRDRNIYLEKASRFRSDLLALDFRTKSFEQLLISARDASKPKLDLISTVGYDSYQSGSQFERAIQTVEFRQKYPDWSIGLRFSSPLENHSGSGGVAIANAQLNQTRIRQQDLKRSIDTAILTTLYSLQNVSRDVETSDMAVVSYQKAVENEREKYLMGESTLFDLLFMQDKLDSVQLSRIDARYRGAILHARLQFESGTMIDCHATECVWNADAAILTNEPAKRNHQ